ncbi:MAG: DUF4230 domain-containing protein [Deltaproteobacteria bacterium]|nr:DUF4230 domain-containing protein [Deltaproteobacteria bacterium]
MLLFAASAGAYGMYSLRAPPPKEKVVDGMTILTRIREVARLETLDVSVHKKIAFQPDPQPQGSVLGELWNWAKHTLRPPKGRAIVFANVHIGLDLEQLGSQSLLVKDERVWIVLPPLFTRVEILPGETEVIDSNLDSQQTAELLELAKVAIERDTAVNKQLADRARASSERAIKGLLYSLGFKEVLVVEALPQSVGHGA